MKEKQLQTNFIQFLNRRDIKWLRSPTISGVGYSFKTGVPDIQVIENGKCIFIELKVGRNKLSKSKDVTILRTNKKTNITKEIKIHKKGQVEQITDLEFVGAYCYVMTEKT